MLSAPTWSVLVLLYMCRGAILYAHGFALQLVASIAIIVYFMRIDFTVRALK